MNSSQVFSALGGLGLFLFSLRTLMRLLQRTLSRRLRGAVGRALDHPLKCLSAGVLATLGVQASSITVLSTMGLLGSTLISLEQGYLIMLGATLGTTLKAWMVGYNALMIGPLLVGICSLALLAVRRTIWRDLLEGLLAIGLALWGTWLAGRVLAPLMGLPLIEQFLAGNPGQTLGQQAGAALIGMFLAACTQSSSSVVAVVITLAAEGTLSYLQGASLILGANIGTTFGPLLASWEYSTNLRRLALAHCVVKVLGVLITLFFFPQFTGAWTWLIPEAASPQQTLSFRLAAAHSGFNLINVCCWGVLSSLVLRLVTWLVPARNQGPSSSLAPVVRRILRRSPERSYLEALRQLELLIERVKAQLDLGGALVSGELRPETRLENRLLEQREFSSLKESTYELLLQALSQRSLEVPRLMTRLADLEEVYFQALRLRDQLEQGLLREQLQLPASLAQLGLDYRSCLDQLWLVLLFPQQSPAPTLDPFRLAQRFQEAHLQALESPEEYSSAQLAWAFDLVGNLRSLLLHLAALVDIPNLRATTPDPDLTDRPDLDTPAPPGLQRWP